MFCRELNGFHDFSQPERSQSNNNESLQMWARRIELEKVIERPFLRAYTAWRQSKAQDDFKSRHLVSEQPLAIGNKVMYLNPVRPSKNHPPYLGPFTVESYDHKTGHYMLRDSLNTAKKIRATLDQLKPAPNLMELSEQENDDPIYHVDRLLNHRISKSGDYEYFVSWKGFDESSSSWEPAANILDAALITDYWSSKKRTHSKRSRK
jgi:hypothetical protein